MELYDFIVREFDGNANNVKLCLMQNDANTF